MSFDDTLKDMAFLKKAMIENDVTKCRAIVLKYENKLQLLTSQRGNSMYSLIEMVPNDRISTLLMPEDVPVSLVPKRTKSDGNCLYNAASMAIYGSDELCHILRLLVAGELYLNVRYYANHPHFKSPFSPTHYSELGAFAIALSCDYDDASNKEKTVRQEAIETSTPGKWSAFLQILGLSSILDRPLFCVYPPVHEALRAVLHGKVLPRRLQQQQHEFQTQYQSLPHVQETVFIMFTRDSNLNSTHGVAFQPNHFVPLILPRIPNKVNTFVFDEDEFPPLCTGNRHAHKPSTKR